MYHNYGEQDALTELERPKRKRRTQAEKDAQAVKTLQDAKHLAALDENKKLKMQISQLQHKMESLEVEKL